MHERERERIWKRIGKSFKHHSDNKNTNKMHAVRAHSSLQWCGINSGMFIISLFGKRNQSINVETLIKTYE